MEIISIAEIFLKNFKNKKRNKIRQNQKKKWTNSKLIFNVCIIIIIIIVINFSENTVSITILFFSIFFIINKNSKNYAKMNERDKSEIFLNKLKVFF